MVMSCCAYNCTRRANTKSNVGHVTFHCFPKDEKLLNKWITAVRRKDWQPSKNSRLCSLHFTADSYETSGWSSRPKLKSDAVPNIFDFPAYFKKVTSRRLAPRELNLLPILSEDTIQNRSPPPESLLPLLSEEALEDSTEAEVNELLQFSPKVIIEEVPPIKKAPRKCFLGDFKDDMSHSSTDDVISFTTIAKKIMDKKNKQIKLLKQKNRRLEKKVSELQSLLNLRTKNQTLDEVS